MTAARAHGDEAAKVQESSGNSSSPGWVLPAPSTLPLPPPVRSDQRSVWSKSGIAGSASPWAASVSMTRVFDVNGPRMPGIEAVVPVPANELNPVGAPATPANEAAPPTVFAAAVRVATTLLVPTGGSRRYQISTRLVVPSWKPLWVMGVPPYVMLVTWAPAPPIDMPTTSMRPEPGTIVCGQESVAVLALIWLADMKTIEPHGTGVGVTVGVNVGVKVGVTVGVDVNVSVGDGVGVKVAVGVSVNVSVGEGVGVKVAVGAGV